MGTPKEGLLFTMNLIEVTAEPRPCQSSPPVAQHALEAGHADLRTVWVRARAEQWCDHPVRCLNQHRHFHPPARKAPLSGKDPPLDAPVACDRSARICGRDERGCVPR